MRPLIITTHRTGSTLICELLFNIAVYNYKYKNNLDEYFTITTLYDTVYSNVNGIIKHISTKRTEYNRACATYENDFNNITRLQDLKYPEVLERIRLLENDLNYMIKLFPTDFKKEVLDFVTKNYNIVYLERRDKLKQFLSFLGLVQTNIAHYTNDSTPAVNRIMYDSKWATKFICMDGMYHTLKRQYPSNIPTLYYEDFIAEGADENALIKLLDLPVTRFAARPIKTVATPYRKDLEDLIINKDEWLADKEAILEHLRFNEQGY